MTTLVLSEAIKRAEGHHGQAWEYSSTLARFVLRVWPDHATASGIYFMCGGCRRIEVSTHWHPVRLEVRTADDSDRLILTDGEHCRIECDDIHAFESAEFYHMW